MPRKPRVAAPVEPKPPANPTKILEVTRLQLEYESRKRESALRHWLKFVGPTDYDVNPAVNPIDLAAAILRSAENYTAELARETAKAAAAEQLLAFMDGVEPETAIRSALASVNDRLQAALFDSDFLHISSNLISTVIRQEQLKARIAVWREFKVYVGAMLAEWDAYAATNPAPAAPVDMAGFDAQGS